MLKKFTSEEKTEALQKLGNGWQLSGDGMSIHNTFKFDDFIQAWAFISQIALMSEKEDHYPQWSNLYNKVTISLTTYDVGGLSGKDVDIASRINGLYLSFTKYV